MAHARNSKASGKGKGSEKGSSEEQKEEMLTLDMFVSRTLPLIELEKVCKHIRLGGVGSSPRLQLVIGVIGLIVETGEIVLCRKQKLQLRKIV